MKNKHYIILLVLFIVSIKSYSQMEIGRRYPKPYYNAIIEKGDTIPYIQLRTVYCFPKRVFKSEKEEKLYWRDVLDVKKTLPLAKLIHGIMLETYEYIETLPTQKEKDKHLKKMQSELFNEYKPVLKKLNYRQGKLLIRLIDRECKSSSYDLIEAYLGSFAAGFWQGFGKLFGVSLKQQWEPKGKDKDLEKICFMVEYGMI